MREIWRLSFWQLTFVYVIISALVALLAIPKFALHFELFAVITAAIGALALKAEEKDREIKWLVWIAVLIIALLRIIPYLHTNIPLGYDAAFYTSAIDQYASADVENWFSKWSTPGLFMLTTIFKTSGVETETILTAGVILLEILLGLMIYLTAAELFNKKTAAFAILLYSVSLAQYVTFQLMYLKNILGMILILAAILFAHKKQYLLTFITGAFLAAVHRPSFLLFGLCYIAYDLMSIRKKEFLPLTVTGALIAASALLLYAKIYTLSGFVSSHIAVLTEPTAGAFPPFIKYMFMTLPYLSSAFLGYFLSLKQKKFNMLFIWFTIAFAIVFFKLFFYNRFVIFLDISFVIFAAYALSVMHSQKKLTTTIIIILVAGSMIATTGMAALKAVPNITPTEYRFMKEIPQYTGENSTIISNMVDDAHWLAALSSRHVAAPGMFDYGKWTHKEWRRYWTAEDFAEIKDIMDKHPRPLYIYLGENSPRGITKKFYTCTENVVAEENKQLLRYTC